jgi:hypothetical protein
VEFSKNPVGPVGSSLNVVGFSGEICVITRLPKVNDAALAVVARASDATVVASRRAFILTPNAKV